MVSTYRYLRNSITKLFTSSSDYEFLESSDVVKVKRKLANGYDVYQPITDCKFHDHETIRPIHFACARSTPQVVGCLLDFGAKVDDETDSGLQPIHFAVIYKKIHIIDELMNSSADANVQDDKGYTPLHYAVETKNLGAVKRLLKSHGADACLKNKQSNDALAMAKDKSYKSIVEFLQDWESQKQSNQKIQKVLSAQVELSNDVKKVDQKVESMHDQIKKEICDELRGDIQEGFAKLETTYQMHINNQIAICNESAYNSDMSLAGRASVHGNVPSLIMQFEKMSSSDKMHLSVARIPQLQEGKTSKRKSTGFITKHHGSEIQCRRDFRDKEQDVDISTSSDIGEVGQQDFYDDSDYNEMEIIRRVLRKNYISLANSMKARPMINYLFQEEVIGIREREHLTDSLKTNTDRCEYLVNEVLWKGSPRDFRTFLAGLEEIGQPHIAERICNTDPNSMYSRRTPGTLYNVPPSAAQSAPLFTNLTKLWKSGDILNL